MNNIKRLERYINQKNRNNNKNDLNFNLSKTYQFNQTTIRYRNGNSSKTNLQLNNTYANQKRNFQNYMKNKARLKVIPGMFSYKRAASHNLNSSYESKNASKINSNQASHKLNINKHNHLLVPNLKFLIDNSETSSLRTLTNNDNILNNFPSISSLNLNKYKITNDFNNRNRSLDIGNTFNNTNYNYDFLKYNNIIINNIQQPKYKTKSKINEKLCNSKKISKTNLNQYSNIIKNKMSKDNLNNSIEQKIEIKNFFANKSKAENESRRMIIEYLKTLKIKEKNKYKINIILRKHNISHKVLNQKIILDNINNYNNTLSNSLFSNYNKKIEAPKKKTNIKNINKFLNDMDDITNDKINMIKFLSVPRIMELIHIDKKYKYIFMLVPNQFSYLNGIESYIFQWNDIKTRKSIGGFDLIKVNSCCINYKNDKNVLIETFDGVYHRQYELITTSNDISSYYVKSINYLSRLEKCKIYKQKYICI